MAPVIFLVAIVLVPVLVLMVLRTNAALIFLSLCLGSVLTQFVAPDVGSAFELFSAHTAQPLPTDHRTIKLILLLLPVILTTIFMVRTVRGHTRLLLNLLPAAGVGSLGALLVIPLLPAGLSHDIISSAPWSAIQRAQDLIVGSSAIVCLLVLWLQRPKAGGEGKHAKAHKG